MKKLLAWCLCLLMLATCWTAVAEQAPMSSSLLDVDALEKFASFAETDGVYTVRSYAADAALRELAKASGACYFTLELTGVASLGIVQPTLTLYYRGGRALNASAVALVIGDTRYVLAASSATSTLGRRRVEVITAPLTRDALPLIAALASASSVRLRVCGDEVYTVEIDPAATSTADALTAQSLTGSQAMLDALAALPMDDYALWDIGANWWEARNGFAPRAEIGAVALTDEQNIAYDDMGMLALDDRGASVREAQTLLIGRGFLYGTATQSFDEEMQTAVRSAQRYYDRMETGCVDAALIACLKGEAIAPAAETAAETGLEIGTARVHIERAWFAKAVAPSVPQDGNLTLPLNGDNRLLIADGALTNIAATGLRLYRDMTAAFVCGEYRFDATLVCDADEGKAFSTDVLPLATVRFTAYAEVPAAATEMDGWQLTVSLGDANGLWQLQ